MSAPNIAPFRLARNTFQEALEGALSAPPQPYEVPIAGPTTVIVPIPPTAFLVLFRSNVDFFANRFGAAAIPSGAPAYTASELNPVGYELEPAAVTNAQLGIAANGTGHVQVFFLTA